VELADFPVRYLVINIYGDLFSNKLLHVIDRFYATMISFATVEMNEKFINCNKAKCYSSVARCVVDLQKSYELEFCVLH